MLQGAEAVFYSALDFTGTSQSLLGDAVIALRTAELEEAVTALRSAEREVDGENDSRERDRARDIERELNRDADLEEDATEILHSVRTDL
jgi:hypothetical protein